jgi:hypothetical protein
MWYNTLAPIVGQAYAESDDGITWRRPELGMLDVSGAANYVDAPMGHFGLFLIDEGPAYAEPARRYKLAYYHEGMCVAFSADGLRFDAYRGNPVIPEYDPDIPKFEPGSNLVSDIIDGCWDPLGKEYLVACKVWQSGFPGTPPHAAEGLRRIVGMTTSKDFLHWERPRIIVTPDPDNGLEEFYGLKPMVRGNLYIGFLRVLRDDLPATPGGPVAGIGWTELATSRDRRVWIRHQEPFIDRDPRQGQWDHAMAWYGDCITVGDREYVYYGGYRAGHKIRGQRGDRTIGMGFLRKNGFVSRDVDDQGGSLKTPLALLPGEGLTVNADVRGELRVRLLDAKGDVVQGFDGDDCAVARGDSVSHRIRWRGKSTLPRDKPIALEFLLKDVDLYAFSFTKE